MSGSINGVVMLLDSQYRCTCFSSSKTSFLLQDEINMTDSDDNDHDESDSDDSVAGAAGDSTSAGMSSTIYNTCIFINILYIYKIHL